MKMVPACVNHPSRWSGLLVVALAVLMAGPVRAAWGGAVPSTSTLVSVHAVAGSTIGDLVFYFPANTTIEGTYSWSLPAPATIYATDGTTVIGTVNSLNLAYNADPSVSLDFNVTAGASTTEFDISSATINFAPVINPDAYAYATVTTTDTGSAYAKLTGQFPFMGFNMAYEARYNGTNKWANLILPIRVDGSGVSVMAEESRPAQDTPPPWLRETITDTVSSIATQFRFTLTANDSASGVSVFDVTPEPGTLLLLALGMGVARRTRRR